MPKRKSESNIEPVLEEFVDNGIPIKIKTRPESDDELSYLEYSDIKVEPCEFSQINGHSLPTDEPFTRSIGIQTDDMCVNNEKLQKILHTLKKEQLLKSKLMVENLFKTIEDNLKDSSSSMNRKDVQQENTLLHILSSWGLKHLMKFFQEQNITLNVLSLMSSNDVSEITQQMKLGDKILFKHNLEKWRNENKLPPLAQHTANDTQEPQLQSSCSEFEHPKVLVLDILKQHKSGCKILKYYEKTQNMSEEHRSCIMNIIVQHFESKDIHMSLQTSYQLENQILKIFPTEKIEYYRTERRGKIYSKFYNKKKILKSLKNNETNPAAISSDAKESLVPEDDAQIHVQKLKLDNLSAEEFNAAWVGCVKFRLNQIRNDCQNISEALKLWPQYKSPNASKFIDGDFNVIYKNATAIISWEDKFLKLYNYLKNNTYIRDKSINEIIATLDKPQQEEDKDSFHLKLLWCLHYNLYQTKKCAKKCVNGKMEYGKYTMKDSQESFIYINSTMQSLEDHLNHLSTKNETIPPFILGLGDVNSFKIDKFFVYLDSQLIIFDSFREAFNICFKSFHIFNMDYPLASGLFWIFVENYFYDMSKTEKTNTKVCILLDKINNM